MSFKRNRKTKRMFFKYFAIIENINNFGHWLCCCKYYFGCQTINNCLGKQKRYCCYCHFTNRHSKFMLQNIKRDYKKLQNYYDEVVQEINQFQFA